MPLIEFPNNVKHLSPLYLIQGMEIYFSGDDIETPLRENIFVKFVNSPISLYVIAYGTGQGNLLI